MRLHGLLDLWGAKLIFVCKHVACSPGKILDLLLDAIWWNLGLFSHKHDLPLIIVLLKPLYC